MSTISNFQDEWTNGEGHTFKGFELENRVKMVGFRYPGHDQDRM